MRRSRVALFSMVVVVAIVVPLAVARAAGPAKAPDAKGSASISGPHVGPTIHPGVMTEDLRSLPRVQVSPQEGLPVRTPEWFPKPARAPIPIKVTPTGVTPRAPGEVLAPAQGQSFDGMFGGGPPDENAAVGTRYVVQTINTSMAVYDKGTGALMTQASLLSFFAAGNTGTSCDYEQRGDPVVLYDSLADRFIITDLSRVDEHIGPWYECIAVARTSDPISGGWNFYAIGSGPAGPGELTNRWLNDYPKLGVWPDGYYMMADMFDTVACPGGPGCQPGDTWHSFFTTVRVWAFDRAAMLVGNPITPVSFDVANVFSMVPTHMTSASDAPPAGRVNYFGVTDYPDPSQGQTSTTIHIYKFHSDFAVPANSTFTGPFNVTVPAYTSPSVAPPMPGTNITLDTLGTRLMYQFQYRNRGGVESLWGTHSIDQGGFVATRWYQFNVTGDPSPPTLAQSGTTANTDSTHRWMAHLASDRFGNMAIEYSNSSSSINPGVRYNGRLVSDGPGTLQTESTLITGPGVFPPCTPTPPATTCGARWGDYSSMQIDPVDDCTFWFTNQYITAGGGSATRIGSARFAGCTCNVQITKTHSPDPVLAGGVVAWNLHVSNSGPVGAYAVTVNDTITRPLAAPVTPPSGWTCSAPAVGATGTVTCTGILANGQSVDIGISVTAPNAITTISNTGVVSTGSTNTAPPGSTTATDSVGVLSPANVFGTKVISSTGNLIPFEHVRYTIVLSNVSAYDQFDNPGDEFTDTLPSQLTLSSASASSGTVTTGGNTVHWNGSIPGGGSVTIMIDAVISSGAPGETISNQGTIHYDGVGDGNNGSTRLTDDPGLPGNEDPTVFRIRAVIPTMGGTGLVVFMLLLAISAVLLLSRRQTGA